MAPIFHSTNALIVYTVLRIKSGPSLCYELSFGSSLAKVSRDGCKVFLCVIKEK